MFNRPLIGEILIDLGLTGGREVEEARKLQQTRPGRLGELLVDAGAVTPAGVAKALAQQLDLDLAESIDIEQIDLDLLDYVPLAYARARRMLPLRRVGDTLRLAVVDPLDHVGLDHIGQLMAVEVEPVVAAPQTVFDALNLAYDRHDRLKGTYGDMLDDGRRDEVVDPGFEDVVDLLGSGGDDEAPVIQFVNTTFVRAARDRVSDIHIEPFETGVRVRFRVDGVLTEVTEVPQRFLSSIVARIKIMAGLNIAEKRLPQDGRIRIKLAGKDIDIRVATAPTAHGERVTMRLLDKSAVALDLAAIGMDRPTLDQVEDLITRPYGIVLVTGPTGSGKTTTLYSCLARINKPELNILTVEDPIEYQLDGISQVAVNPKIQLTFASGLRSFLRHDPDVIMVGEIRDTETAEIAIQASLTGHLVFSTIHTNDAAGAFTRLIDMGIEPFLVASSLLANMAQRLVRRLCRDCREAYVPTDRELGQLELTRAELESAGGILYRPTGCEECNHRGYRGRSGIYELLPVSNEVRQLVMARADAGTIRRQAVAEGMRTLRRFGGLKVLEGVTSIEEVLRVTQQETV
ncbi:MAG: type II secretion system ATPase GspE [Myxococcales bacterium]|nr:type II secretion system ATPase GspE [Myxococcales bacterium]MCB9520044.1 type II secretion system ATPase GspE [Myxococcales bacterium]